MKLFNFSANTCFFFFHILYNKENFQPTLTFLNNENSMFHLCVYTSELYIYEFNLEIAMDNNLE